MMWRVLIFVLLISPVHASWNYNSQHEKKLWGYAEQLTRNRLWNSIKTSEVYDHLKQISNQKVDVVAEYALKYFQKEIVEYCARPERLFNILQAHKPKNLEKICEYMQFFKRDTGWLYNKDVWDFFAENKMKRVASVCDCTLKLLGSQVSESNIHLHLLSEVIKIPEKRLDEICLQTLKFTSNRLSNAKKLNILRVFKENPSEKWEELCEYASKIVPDNDPEKYADALIFWGKLPPETVKKLLKNDPSIDEITFGIIREFMEIWRGHDFLKILLEKTSDNIENFQRRGAQFLKFMKFKMDHYDEISNVLQAILVIESDRLELVCDYARDLLLYDYYSQHSERVVKILNILREIPPFLLKEIRIFNSKLRFKPEIIDQEMEVIELLASSPSNEWEMAYEFSPHLLGDKASLEERSKLTIVLLCMPSRRWKPLLDSTPLLFKEDMEVNVKGLLVCLLGQFPSYRLPKICEYVPKLLSPKMDPEEILRIFEILIENIPPDRLETVCLRALPLIEKTSVVEKTRILRNINDISDERWKELEELVPFFIQNESDIVEKTTEILKLSKIDPQVLQVLEQYGTQFKFHEMNEEEKKKFINELEEINKTKSYNPSFPYISLSEAVQNAFGFITSEMNIDNALQIIRKFKRLDADELKRVLEFLPKLISSKMNVECIGELIQKVGFYCRALYTPFGIDEIISQILKLHVADMSFEVPILVAVSKKMKSIEEFEILIKYFPHITKILSGKEINPEFYEKNFQRWDGERLYQDLQKLSKKLLKFPPGTFELSYENMDKFIKSMKLKKTKLTSNDMLKMVKLFKGTPSKKMEIACDYMSKFRVRWEDLEDLLSFYGVMISIDTERVDKVCEYTLKILKTEMDVQHATKLLKRFNNCLSSNVSGVLGYVPSLITDEMEWGEAAEILSNLEKYDLKYQYSGLEKTDDPMGLLAALVLQSNSKFSEFYYNKIKEFIDVSILADTNPLFQSFQIIKIAHHVEYKKLYKKRRMWKKYNGDISPIVTKFHNKDLVLRPEFFQNKLRTENFTIRDLPQNYELLKDYFHSKMKKFERYISVGNQLFITKTQKLTGFNHPGQFMGVSKKLTRYFTIFERQKTGEDYLSDSQVKLFRLLDIFQKQEKIESDIPEQITFKSIISLSKSEESLLKCLSEIHKCPESVALGIAEVYHPYALSFSLLKDDDPQKIVKRIIVQIIENFMYCKGIEDFYPSLCGYTDIQCENEQMIYVMNSVGGAIGLDPWLNMEGNPSLVYPKLLKLTPRGILEILYQEHLKPTYFIQKFKKYFDDMEISLKEKVEEFYCVNKEIVKKEKFWNQGGISQKAMLKILKDEEVIGKKFVIFDDNFFEDDYSF